MLKKVVYRLLRHRHFWRDVGFDELNEVYIVTVFRALSLSLTGIFIPLFMFKLGYDARAVMIIWFWYFFARVFLFDFLAGYLLSRIGPKHTIMYGNFLLIASSATFLTLPNVSWPLWVLGGLNGGAAAVYWIPFHADFSKINHKEHGGKELGYLNIMNKIGAILGPAVGGLVATIFGGQYIFLVAMLLLILGGIPLLRTAEPIPIHRKLELAELDHGKMKPDLFSYFVFAVENTISGLMWPIWIALIVLASTQGYAKLGLLASATVLVSMCTAFTIGKIIDNHKGRLLLRSSVTANAVLHLFRPFINTFPGALLVNMVNEGVTVGYQMPYTKGMYDKGDSLDGLRAAYFTTMEWTGSLAKLLTWTVLIILTLSFNTKTVLIVGFVVAAVASLLIMKERFPALSPNRFSSTSLQKSTARETPGISG